MWCSLQLSGSSEHPLRVTHFHFTAWPDHGVPDYATPILAFHRRVRKEHKSSIDHVIEQVKMEESVNIPQVINKIRRQRMKVVQTVVGVVCMHHQN